MSPRIALSRSSGFTSCFSMVLVNSSSSAPIFETSRSGSFEAVRSVLRFPRTEDISAVNRAMKSFSDSAG